MNPVKTITWLSAALLFFTFSCQNKDKVIPRDEIVPVLVDIHLLDGAIQRSKYSSEINPPDTIGVYDYVLKEHGYTREQLDSSMNYYTRRPRTFERIYQEVVARLNRMETRVKEEKEQERKERMERRRKKEKAAPPDQRQIPEGLKKESIKPVVG